jgi:hypothetical protein
MQVCMTNALKRMAELLPRIESIMECCRTCGSNQKGFCKRFESDIPAESIHLKGCEHWFFDDIPF